MLSEISVPNERTRVYLTIALVDEGTIAVDGPLKRFGRVYDLSRHGGAHFTDKAPGSSFLAAPVYAVASLTRARGLGIFESLQVIRTWFVIPVGILGFALLRWLLRRLSVPESMVQTTSLAYVLGSPILHYSTAFYGHVPVATLTIAALCALQKAGCFERELPERIKPGWAAFAGVLAGLMGFIEYQAAVLSALLLVPTFRKARHWSLGTPALFCLGALPSALALLAYNAEAFGGALELSYQHLAAAPLKKQHGAGLAGTTHPTWGAVFGLLLSQHRGIIATAPLLGFGLIALPFFRRRWPPTLWLTATLSIGYLFLMVSSSSAWHGGWSFGPRLLIPIMPLLALSAALASAEGPRWTRSVLYPGLAILGIAYNLLVKVTFSELPVSLRRPLADSVGPMLRAGMVAPNVLCKMAPLALVSVLPLALSVGALLGLALAPNGLREVRARMTRASLALALAGGVLAAGFMQPPSRSEKEQANWMRLVRRWSQREQCGGGLRAAMLSDSCSGSSLNHTYAPSLPDRD